MISLKCDSPVRIRNKYTGDWMYVNCRKCSACMINKVNTKCVHLLNEMKKYPFKMMVTLTYDNEHIPYMTINDSRVFRGVPGRVFPKILSDIQLDKNIPFETILPNGFPEGCFTSVLFYPDLQNFFKRLRIYYERKFEKRFPYFYHSIGEYGTTSKRCHFHVLFFGREEFTESFRNAVIDCWSLHDWSKLELEEIFKLAEEGVSSYLTSYVNSMFGNHGFLSQKAIMPKVQRSKKIDFSVDQRLLQAFQESVKRGISRADFIEISRTFGKWDCSKLGDFSFRLVPSKIISSYFAVPTYVQCSNSHTFYECCGNLLTNYFKTKREGGEIDYSSYRLYLSYKKYCTLRNLSFNDGSLMDFCLDNQLVNSYFKSCQLRLHMESFNGDYRGYLDDCFNTKVDDIDKRNYWLVCNGLKKIDDVNSPGSYVELQTYKSNYRYKLLPKHLHGLLNGNNI